ncbi:MAG: hypothetical protein CMB32_03360, partial [Euryarchaeota archaeon]|nr:hypothetical protein [Euryarchaeota archaeon]
QADVDTNEAASDAADSNLQSQIDDLSTDADQLIIDMNAADADLQESIDLNATLSNNTDNGLLAMIIVNSDADEAESQAGDAADDAIQADVDANEIASDAADAALQSQIDEINLPDNNLQEAIDANADADAAESLAGTVADTAIQADVDANEIASIAADEDLQDQIDSIESSSSETQLQTQLHAAQLATNTDGITGNAFAISELQSMVDIMQIEINNLQSQINSNTGAIQAMDGTQIGQMNYWNGSSWVEIPMPPNDGQEYYLRLVGGLPIWD